MAPVFLLTFKGEVETRLHELLLVRAWPSGYIRFCICL